MNTVRLTLLILSSVGAFIGGMDEDIIADMAESGKTAKMVGDIPPAPTPEPEPEPEADLEPEPEPDKDNPPAPVDPVARINEQFGTEFKTLDDFFTSPIPAKYKELSGYEAKVADRNRMITELQARNAELETQADPLQHFANEAEYRRQQLLKKHPELDPVVLSRVAGKDLKEMNPLDVLALKLRLKDGEIYSSEQEAREYIMAEYELEDGFNLEELDTLKKNKIKKAAKDARLELETLQAEITLPAKEDHSAERKAAQDVATAQWTPWVQTALPEQLKTLKILAKDGKVDFEFPVEPSFIKAVTDSSAKIIEGLVSRGYVVTPETQQEVVRQYTNFYIKDNWDKIARAYANDMVSKMSLEQFNESHNPRPLRRDTAPAPDQKDRAKQSKEKAEAAILADL